MSSKESSFRGTSDKERPAALVVCSYLGWPITGGVAAAVRQLIYYLHAIGLTIFCTAFKVNDEEQNEFLKSGINLVYPNPPRLYRRDKQEITWLQDHRTFFPDISKLESVKMVCSFSMVTSIPASAIRENVFPGASFYVVNPYKLDTPLSILGYDEYRYKIWKEYAIESSKDAKAVFSIGSEIFDHFDDYYQRVDEVIYHFSLMLTPDDDLFDLKRSTKIPTSGKFQILMFVDEVDIEELSSQSELAQVMNHVAESFHGVQKEPPKWVIVSIPKGREDDLKSKLNPNSHPYLKITYKSFEVSEAINLLQESHLLVVPPSSINSVKLSLSAIAIGIPLLVPQYSSSQKAIDEYLPDLDAYESAVDMKSDDNELLSKINGAITNYSRYTAKAVALRKMLKVKAKKLSDDVKKMLINFINQHEDFNLANTGEEAPERPGPKLPGERSNGSSVNPFPDESQSDSEAKRPGLGAGQMSPGDDKSRCQSKLDKEETGTKKLKLKNDQMTPGDDENGSLPKPDQEGTARKRRELKNGDGSLKDNQGTGSSTNNGSDGHGNENHSNPDDTNQHQNTQGRISVRLRVSGGVPENNRPMADIENALFRHASTQTNAEDYMNRVTAIHPDLSGESIEEGSLNFIMRCGSSDAADALWNAYSSGRLDRMADKTFLSIPILDDIGARMLSLETIVDYQEYLQCKEDITRGDISSKVSYEGAKSPEDLCDVELVSIMNMEGEKQAKQQKISIQWKRIEVKTKTKDKLRSTVFSDSQTFSESEKSCMDEWVTLKRRIQQPSDTLVLKKDLEKLKQQKKILAYDVLSMKSISKRTVEELEKMRLSHDRIMKGIVPKDTVRRLSRQGNGPGEVRSPWGLTINHNGQVVVSDNGYGDQPGSVKTVTADTAQIISTITFHGLPNIFRPTDVKMSKNNLYYIADDGNKCILVCDAKSRLKQIIDIGEVDSPAICLGPDDTVFVVDYYNDHVIKYSKAGEMISSKQLSSPWYLTMNSKYQLIVPCYGEHCIYVLDSNLNTLHTFGHEHLVEPRGVSVDAIGENIYVADEKKVKIFSAQGEYLTDVTVDGRLSSLQCLQTVE
ncbi:uncharacterized protein [Ptychodera flava]|uniref:uncharacterized protein n=1 Tax=Ptychodera flava TaxID=63121 RepID=UPI00396A0474